LKIVNESWLLASSPVILLPEPRRRVLLFPLFSRSRLRHRQSCASSLFLCFSLTTRRSSISFNLSLPSLFLTLTNLFLTLAFRFSLTARFRRRSFSCSEALLFRKPLFFREACFFREAFCCEMFCCCDALAFSLFAGALARFGFSTLTRFFFTTARFNLFTLARFCFFRYATFLFSLFRGATLRFSLSGDALFFLRLCGGATLFLSLAPLSLCLFGLQLFATRLGLGFRRQTKLLFRFLPRAFCCFAPLAFLFLAPLTFLFFAPLLLLGSKTRSLLLCCQTQCLRFCAATFLFLKLFAQAFGFFKLRALAFCFGLHPALFFGLSLGGFSFETLARKLRALLLSPQLIFALALLLSVQFCLALSQ
jgi:hypothetical protein